MALIYPWPHPTDHRPVVGPLAWRDPRVEVPDCPAMAEKTTSSGKRQRGRGGPRPGGGAAGATTPLVDLAAITSPPELVLFNEFVESEKRAERERQRTRQLESAKDKAAAKVKELRSGSDKEALAEAEQAYREALEALKRHEAGEDAPAEGSTVDDEEQTGSEAPAANATEDHGTVDQEATVETASAEVAAAAKPEPAETAE